MTIPDGLRLNEFGYYEVLDKPTAEELQAYYAQRYYQENRATYQAAYSPAEQEHIQGKLRLRQFVAQVQPGTAAGSGRFLDVGCGEGWALAYFQEQGYDVLGLDFSSFSLDRLNPAVRGRLRTGDLHEELGALKTEEAAFDLLWLDNVLEHVPDPAALLAGCRAVAAPDAVLMVEVPNDFSALHAHLEAVGHIDWSFWVALPDHLSYFNPAGLARLAQATGWRVADVLADHPIDLDLLNPATNYVRDRAHGPASHRVRVEQDNLLQRGAPLPAVAAYYRGLAGVGLGRNMVAFLRPDAVSS